MERGTAPFQVDRKGYHLVIEAVPAWVCTQCGEAYFESPEVDRIQQVLRSIDQTTAELVGSK
jgi:YgiT-type zinc finger domain-containing protein